MLARLRIGRKRKQLGRKGKKQTSVWGGENMLVPKVKSNGGGGNKVLKKREQEAQAEGGGGKKRKVPAPEWRVSKKWG